MNSPKNAAARARRAAQRAALREVAEFLGGDDSAYQLSGVLLRNAHVGTVEELRKLGDPEDVAGIGITYSTRIRLALANVTA